MNRREALAALFGAPMVAAKSDAKHEHLVMTIDGRVVADCLLEKMPFARRHVIEQTQPNDYNRNYAVIHHWERA